MRVPQQRHKRLDQHLAVRLLERRQRSQQPFQRLLERGTALGAPLGVVAPSARIDRAEDVLDGFRAVSARGAQVGGRFLDDGEQVLHVQRVLRLEGVVALVDLLQEVGVIRVARGERCRGGCC